MNVSRAKYLPSHNRGIPVPKEPKTIGECLRKRRLELGIVQLEAARRLGISTVTLSRWECDKVYPTWNHQPDLIAYLGYDPFPSCGLRDPHGNEPLGVAFLSTGTLGDRIRTRRLELKLTAKECAQKLKVDAKTLHGWENNRHQPSAGAKTRIIAFLGYDPFQN